MFKFSAYLLTAVLVCYISENMFAQAVLSPPSFAVKVYNDIFRSMDDGRTEKPRLFVQSDNKQVAVFNPKGGDNGEPVIFLGVQFIQMVRNFGKDSTNALAHVLGHELAHVFLKQNEWISEIGTGYASPEYNKQIKSLKKTLQDSLFERQADEHAAFYCHVAGYNTVSVGESVLDSIYRRFGLNDKMLSRYPSLQERKLIVRASQQKMQVLRLMYDDAILSLMSRNYNMSEVFFRAIIKEGFTSNEMYNNLGLCYLMRAIEELDISEFPYRFPVQIQFNSKLPKNDERSLSHSTFSLLDEALQNFRRAIAIGYGSEEADINTAIAYFILGDYSKMNEAMQRVNDSKDPLIRQSLNILDAIQYHKRGELEKAKGIIESIGSDCIVARANLCFWEDSHCDLRSNSEINDSTSLTNFTRFNFNSEEARKAKEQISNLTSRYDFVYKAIDGDNCSGHQWRYVASRSQPRIEIYTFHSAKEISLDEWNEITVNADGYFVNGNVKYAILGQSIFRKSNESVINYIIF